MADIRLAKPAPNTAQNIPSTPEGHFIFDFSTGDAMLSRDGDDLLLSFEDGATIRLEDFYTTYSKDNMPSFEVDGAEIAGEDFFMAMNEPDLMPAAGPAARAAGQGNGNRFHDYVNASLLDGLDRLGGLDVGWPGSDVTPETDGSATLLADTDYPVTVTPGTPGDIGDIPVLDNPDNPHDGGAGASVERDVLRVQESGLRGAQGASANASGYMTIEALDGVASIVIGGVVVYDGALTGATVSTDEGYLEVTGFNPSTGRLDYTYHLTQPTQEHGGEGNDQIAHDLVVTVTDTDGSTGTGVVTVVITDDVPTAHADNATLTEAEAQAGDSGENVLTNDVFGADGAAEQAVTSVKHGNTEGTVGSALEGAYGKLTLNADGSYTYQLNPGMNVPNGDTWTEEFTYTITDADGDTSETTLTITIEGNGDIPVVTVATPEPGDANIMVDEGGQPEHGGEGHAQSGSGSFTVQLNGEDGVITVGGESGWKVTVTGNSADVTGSVVTVNGVAVTVTGATQGTDGKWTVSYDYALTGSQMHGADNSPTDETLTGEIAISVTDATGDTGSGTLTVQVHDDVPIISVDTPATGSYGSAVTGSVNMAFGADGEKSVTVSLNGETVTGAKDADGNYTFTFEDGSKLTLEGATGDFRYDGVPASGTGTTYEFTFTVEDADGDTDTATTTAELAPKVSYQSSVTSSDNDTLAEVTPVHSVKVPGMSGIREITDGAQVYQGDTLIGEFTLSGGTLFFTQLEAYTHDKDSNSVTLPHQLIVTDSDGREHIVAVDVTIQDSLPYAHNDTIELKEHGEQGVDAEGNVLVNDTLSADGATRVTGVQAVNGNPVSVTEDGVSIEGTLGTLHIRADGTYEYTLREGVSIPDSSIVREEFTYTIMDADGDTSTAAALTILVGKGTVHVKESGIGINENGQKITIPGTLEAEGKVEGKVTDVEAGTTLYTDENIPDKFKLYVESTERNGNIITIHTNYGDLVVNKATGEYTFTLDDGAANPLPNGFEIHQGFNFTTTVGDVNVTQEVVVVIEGTNDAGKLDEKGEGGHDSNQLWIDAKAEGADSVERPYDAVDHPNIGSESTDLGQKTGGTARPTAWLPFTLEDPDFGDSLTFHAVFNGAGNDPGAGASMEGTAFVSYQELLQSMDTTPLSMALTVEWGKFQQNFTSEQLDGMLFCRTDYGIFAITNEAVELKELNNLEGAQYWLTFLVDSDSDVIRQMAEGTGTGASDYGKLLNFSFQVTDKTGNTVQTSTGSGSFADINHVLVHVYGSNDTPEVALSDDGKLAVHDDDVTGYNKYGTASQTGGDRESHTITVEYNGRTYTGTLEAGTMTLRTGWKSITCDVTTGGGSGTNFIISNFKDGYWFINGQLSITITDMRGNSAMYMVNAQNGQLVDIPDGFTLTGSAESENLYGGSGADELYGYGGNDSLWGGAGDDRLDGGAGNDRLYGESGNDTLQGGDGLDILVGGDGDDSLDGGAGDDVIIGDGQGDLQSVIEDAVNAETFRDFLILKSPEELESYMSKFETQNDGNDQLFGGSGNDVIFGMGGDDYIVGGAGNDTIYGGAGNDIIVYDANDVLVNGGEGIDFMVSTDSDLTLDALLAGGEGKPNVDGIEVLIKGSDALSLTSVEQLAADYGISINVDAGGRETLTLDMTKWTAQSDGTYDFNGGADLTLQLDAGTDAALQDVTSADDAAAQQQVFLLQNSNG